MTERRPRIHNKHYIHSNSSRVTCLIFVFIEHSCNEVRVWQACGVWWQLLWVSAMSNVVYLHSVVTVSNILLSVGFGRFCQKNRGFQFGFCLSRFPPVVNVVRLCGLLHIKPAAVRYIFLCITPVDSSKYPTVWDWWRENHHLYPMSHVLQNATCLAVCATDIRC